MALRFSAFLIALLVLPNAWSGSFGGMDSSLVGNVSLGGDKYKPLKRDGKTVSFEMFTGDSRQACFQTLMQSTLKKFGHDSNVNIAKVQIPSTSLLRYKDTPYYQVAFEVDIFRGGNRRAFAGRADVFFNKVEGLAGDVSWECGVSEQGSELVDQKYLNATQKEIEEANRAAYNNPYVDSPMFAVKVYTAHLIKLTAKEGSASYSLFGIETVAEANQQELDRAEIQQQIKEEKKQEDKARSLPPPLPAATGGLGGALTDSKPE